MPSTLPQLVKEQELPAYIELFDIDVRKASGHLDNPDPEVGKYYLTPSTDSPAGIATAAYSKVINGASISFGAKTYLPYPIQISGVENNADGAFARPRLDVANVDQFFGQLSFLYGDLVGSTIVYRRTFETYLESGLGCPPITFTVGKKLVHNVNGLSFELRFLLDRERGYLPKNQMLRDPHGSSVYYPGLGLSKYIG